MITITNIASVFLIAGSSLIIISLVSLDPYVNNRIMFYLGNLLIAISIVLYLLEFIGVVPVPSLGW